MRPSLFGADFGRGAVESGGPPLPDVSIENVSASADHASAQKLVLLQMLWQNMASRSLGSNQVLLGGMTPPASDMAIRSSMPVGYMENAQAYSLLLTSFSSSAAPRMPPTN